MGLPLCAATRCPSPNDCQGYITANGGNLELLPLVACCKALCGQGNEGILALQCGGASNYGAKFIAAYIVVLTIAAFGMLTVGLFVKFKRLSFLINAFGTAIFGTAVTGIYVTYVTSSFTYLKAVVPAIGAMNIAVFSYFFSGFEYNVGVTYGMGPLAALLAAMIPIWRAVPEDSDSNKVALTMLFTAFIWVIHSVSFRVLGYRVQWRYFKAPIRRKHGEAVNECYLLGAGQGHPTWRTPVGQTTGFLLMAFSWAIVRAVQEHLKDHQQCKADWVLSWMLWVPPLLMTGAVSYTLISAMRGLTINWTYKEPNPATGVFARVKQRILDWLFKSEREGTYPGQQFYDNFYDYVTQSRREYVQVVALHRRARNTYTIEQVRDDLVESLDMIIGNMAWLLALLGLIMGWPVTFVMSCMARALGLILEYLGHHCWSGFNWFVITTVTEEHHEGAKRVLTASYTGTDLKDVQLDLNPQLPENGRFVHLPYVLDNIAPEELHTLLNQPPLQLNEHWPTI